MAGGGVIWHDLGADIAGGAVYAGPVVDGEHRSVVAGIAGNSLPASTGRFYRVPNVAVVYHALQARAECGVHAVDFAKRVCWAYHPGVLKFCGSRKLCGGHGGVFDFGAD